MKNNILLIRSSDFQFYCANKLFEKRLINMCIIEEGVSVKTRQSFNKKNILNFIKDIQNIKNFFFRILYLLFFSKFYGNISFHNNRLLCKPKIKLDKNLRVKFCKNINEIEYKNIFKELNPDFLIVFGTRIVNTNLYAKKNFKTLNMHWGISPIYRGEGIVSSLSKNDFSNLGVTIHKLDKKIDDGKILSQRLIYVDKLDNFYSLGLKMTIAGTNLIIDFLNGVPQKKGKFSKVKGKLYDSKYYRKNYRDYFLAYRNINKLKSSL